MLPEHAFYQYSRKHCYRGVCGVKHKFAWKFRLLASAAIAMSALAVPSPGLAQIYLHSGKEEQLASDLVANLEKARAAQIAALDAHRDYVASMLDREKQLVAQREIAIRDLSIVTILDAGGSESSDSAKLGRKTSELKKSIVEDWKLLTGTQDLPVGLAGKLRDGAFTVASSEIVLNRARSSLNLAISQFEAENGVKGEYCNENGEGTPQGEKDGVALDTSRISIACQFVSDARDPILKSYSDVDSDKSININGISILLGNTHISPAPTGVPQVGGEFGQAIAALSKLEGLRKAQAAVAKAVSAQGKALEDYYKCQVALSDRGNTIPGEVENIAKNIQAALLQLASGKQKDPSGKEVDIDPLDTAAFTAIYHSLQAKLPDACSKETPGGKDEKPSTASTGLSAEQILALLKAGDNLATHGTVLAAIQSEALAVQAGTFSKILTGLATSNAKDQPTQEGKIAAATLRILGNIELLGEAESGKLPDLSGILVALADVRMRQEIAKIESDRLNDLFNLANRQIDTLREQAIYLADAQDALSRSGTESFGGALLFYTSSWNKGRIPHAVIADAMVTNRYLPWVARERSIVSASYAMLAPAATELNAYGKGGLTAATIAQYLQVIGLGAIAVNK